MAVSPRALIITRPTEYDQLLGTHGTRQQVSFFLEQRGQTITELDERHSLQQQAMQVVSKAIPTEWRRARLDRADLDRFVFGPEDIIVAVGQDGLVANVAKYLDGQPVVGVNPDPIRNPGVLVAHRADMVAEILRTLIGGRATFEHRAMVELESDDGQRLAALNEIFVGHHGHQSARYRTEVDDASEVHSSSGILIGTGTGATGWCGSVHRERNLTWELPEVTSTDLAWFVREAWPSPWTGTTLTAGRLSTGTLRIRCESDRLVAFGDGIEADHIELSWGQWLTVSPAKEALVLV